MAVESTGVSDFWHYLDTGGITAILVGIAHILMRVGSVETKVNAMWEKFIK